MNRIGTDKLISRLTEIVTKLQAYCVQYGSICPSQKIQQMDTYNLPYLLVFLATKKTFPT